MSLSPPRTAQREGMVASMVFNLNEWFNVAESFLFGFHPSCPPGLLNTHYHPKVCCFLVPGWVCVCEWVTQDSSSNHFAIHLKLTQHCTLTFFFFLSRLVVSDSLRPHGLYSAWNSPDQNTGVGSLSLLQAIFSTQGSNPGLLHCRQILYQLSHKGSPRILEWVAYPFSSGSSWSRNQTRGLLHCRQILYQLSYQGSPHYSILQLKEKLLGILLAAPVVRTRYFHCHGPRFNPWLVRKQILQAAWLSKKKKKNCIQNG